MVFARITFVVAAGQCRYDRLGYFLMPNTKLLSHWLADRSLVIADLVAETGLDRRVVEAIAAGRYTPSPYQRRALATALGIEPDQVAWGHSTTVEHIHGHGHGPQFGRSP
jgi:hypothetical protein